MDDQSFYMGRRDIRTAWVAMSLMAVATALTLFQEDALFAVLLLWVMVFLVRGLRRRHEPVIRISDRTVESKPIFRFGRPRAVALADVTRVRFKRADILRLEIREGAPVDLSTIEIPRWERDAVRKAIAQRIEAAGAAR